MCKLGHIFVDWALKFLPDLADMAFRM